MLQSIITNIHAVALNKISWITLVQPQCQGHIQGRDQDLNIVDTEGQGQIQVQETLHIFMRIHQALGEDLSQSPPALYRHKDRRRR